MGNDRRRKNPSINNGESSGTSEMDKNIVNKPKPDTKPRIQPPKSNKNTKHPRNDYIVFPNFMAPQIDGKSKGLFEKFESRHDHDLVQMYCDSLMDECIGYSFNTNGGYQFYSHRALPVAAKNGWDFYLKQDPNKPLSLKGKGVKIDDMDDKSKQKWKDNVIDEDEKDEKDESDDIDKEDDDKSIGDISDKKTQKMFREIGNEDPKETKKKYAPVVPSGDGKKYISYLQNVGRVNNQLVSFEAMIQYAVYYNRTLVIPWPRHMNHVMGFECGFWDFDRLREIIDIIMEDELPEHLRNKYMKEETIPKECRYIKLVGKGIPKDVNMECEMIYLYEGDLGIFHFHDGPQDVMKYIIPAKYIRDAVEKLLISEFGQLRYRLGVHRRAMDEGGKDPKTGERHVCRWESRGIHGDSRFSWLRNMIKKVTKTDDETYEKIIAMYHHSCAMDFHDLQNILIFHKQEPIKNKEKFFIAHDHQEPWVIQDMQKYGGIIQPSEDEKYGSEEWSQSSKCYQYHKTKCLEFGHCSREPTLRMKEEILFDMWALFYSDFLAGTWMSTLTRTICHWKGFEESMYTGNQCFLKWKWQETIDNNDNSWYTLKGLNETALFD